MTTHSKLHGQRMVSHRKAIGPIEGDPVSFAEGGTTDGRWGGNILPGPRRKQQNPRLEDFNQGKRPIYESIGNEFASDEPAPGGSAIIDTSKRWDRFEDKS